MKVSVIGGGPGGLYFALLAKKAWPQWDVAVCERNRADDTFGFGVVFSDETLGGIEHADPEIYAAMEREFARWDDIDVHYRGTVITSGGHGFAALSRRRLLQILQRRCADLGVRVLFRAEAPDPAALAASYDLVIGSDGANSATRAARRISRPSTRARSPAPHPCSRAGARRRTGPQGQSPRWAKASITALLKHGMPPTCGDSATPLAPSGLIGDGCSPSMIARMLGKSDASGTR